MKFPLAALACCLVSSLCFAAPPKTEEEFIGAVRAAFEAKDVKKIHALTWENGTTAEDRKEASLFLAQSLKDAGEIETVTLEPLPPGFKSTQIAYGKRFEPTALPKGLVKLDYKPDKDKRLSKSLGYAVIEGNYYLITGKSTDLGWKGPADRPFAVSVTGTGIEKTRIHVKYNVSGVDVEEDIAPHAFPCQYISEVTVTSEDPETNATLSIADGKKTIYESAPLQGAGQIQYKRAKGK